VLCDSLKNGIGNALIDTGSQVSLVTVEAPARGLRIDKNILEIHGITGNSMATKGCVDLCIGETTPHKFLVVQELPMNCEVLLGQDWLERLGCRFQIPIVGVDIVLPAYLETLVRIPTTEKGRRLVKGKNCRKSILRIRCCGMH
jgi:hypothetical protein